MDAHLEWEHISSSENLVNFDGRKNVFFDFSLTLQRQTLFYAIVLIFPTVLLNILSLVVFTLPINNTEREEFSLTLILTYFVLLMIIVDATPPTGNQIPKLGLYLIICTVIVVVTFGMSLVLIELHEHQRAKQKRMPTWLFAVLKKFCYFDKCYSDYKNLANKSYTVGKEVGDKDDLLKGKSNKESHDIVDIDIEDYKWKHLANILNYTFFACVLIAHMILPCTLYLL